MAAVNWQGGITTLNRKLQILICSTSFQDLLVVPSNECYVVRTIRCVNRNTAVRREVTAVVKRGGVEYEYSFGDGLSAKQRGNILAGEELNLEENDSVRIKQDSGADVVVFASYSRAV